VTRVNAWGQLVSRREDCLHSYRNVNEEEEEKHSVEVIDSPPSGPFGHLYNLLLNFSGH
jgi:hypothetical protein